MHGQTIIKKKYVHDCDMIVVTVSPVESVNELQIAFTNLTHLYVEILFESLFAKLQKAINSFVLPVCPSVCPHGTTPLPLDGFS
jgi:hypothetical protein